MLVLPWSTQHSGGVSVVVRQLAQQWQRDGQACTIMVDQWAPFGEGALAADERAARFGFLTALDSWAGRLRSLARLPPALWRTVVLLRQTGCTGVNFHYPGLNVVGVSLLKQLGLFRGRLVLSFHGTDVRAPSNATEAWLWCWVFARCDAVTTCSQALRRRLIAEMAAPADVVQVAYSGVDATLFQPGQDGPASPAYLLSSGRFIPLKGHRTLVRAFAEVQALSQAEFAGLRLLIAGVDGPERQPLLALVAELGLADRVDLRLNLTQPEVAALLQAATLAVQPSLEEAFGLAAIEAAACGVSLVASRVGGHGEIVTDGLTGWLFEPNEVQDCTRAIREALANPVERGLRAERLRREVLQRFSWRRFADQIRQLLGA
jgi:glycosyltransferase involved in cell wall biosynthesis